jgi:hypothetical protein
MPEVGHGLFDRLVLEKVKDKMENINCGRGPFHGVINFSRC